MNRRQFASSLALAGLAPAVVPGALAARPAADGAQATTDVTRRVARYIVGARPEDIPAAVLTEARRTVVNWVGCALGGARHETLDHAIAALAPFAGPPQATVLGRRERMDALTVSLMNGMSSHVLDFDDTHLKTVIHPAGPVVPAILALAEQQPIARIDLSVHPLVLELTGKRTPQTGLEGKFSIYAAAALAIVAGAAGPKQFSDEWMRNPGVVALRDRVTATVDPAIGEAQVRAVITLKDGRRLEKYIEHVVGSIERPMSDADLDAKFLDLADGVLPSARAKALLALCRDIDRLPRAGELARAAAA